MEIALVLIYIKLNINILFLLIHYVTSKYVAC